MRKKYLIIHYLWFRRIETEIYVTEGKLNDEVDTHKKYIVDDCRRVHNYDEFITTFISMLGNLLEAYTAISFDYKLFGSINN